MPVPRVDLVIRRGDDFTKPFTIKNNGVAVDLTGVSFDSQVRSTKDSGTVISTASVTVVSATAGQIEWTVTDTQTAAWTETAMVYDIQATNVDGTIETIIEGKIKLDKDVTR